MPWKECHVMDERLRFVARLLEGEKMAPLCAEFGISRKTGYKIFDRYKDTGVTAFTDRSRRPYRQANRLPAPIEATIVRLKREYPGWGAPTIREKLRRQFTGPHLSAISTVHAVLDRHHLVKRRRRRRSTRAETTLSRPTDPNALWRAECAAAASPVRCLRRPLQRRPAAPGARHEGPGRPLHTVAAPVSLARGCDLPVSRRHVHRDPLRPDLLPRAQDQSQSRLRRSE